MDRMARAAELIGEQLAQTTGDQVFVECGAEVATKIRGAETEMIASLDSVPEGKRVLVTDHDAFGYFADRYGFEIAGTVIPGGSTLGSPSSAELADLVATMRAEEVATIFANTAEPETLADAVAAELAEGSTLVDVQVIPLYVGSLGESGSEADSYIGMMGANAQLIAEGLNR
jgi:zinc/manganese transport system substrate-binding protein